MTAKGTSKIIVDIASIPDIPLPTWMRMYEDKIIYLTVEDRTKEYTSFHVEGSTLDEYTVIYATKLTEQENKDLINKYTNE